MNRFLVVLLLMLSFSSFAYDGSKCTKRWVDPSSIFGEGYISSTTSYVSSTGACAAIGLNSREDKIKHFLAHNREHLEVEWANGVHGEYTIAYRELLNE